MRDNRADRVAPTLETDNMAHNPVNHPLRPLYRAISAVVGIYLLLFGVVGLITTSGDDATGVAPDRILGQGGNLIWSILSLIIGAIVLLASIVGRNIDMAVDKYLGWTMLVIGSYGLATGRTDADFLGFTVSTVVVTYLIGIVLILSSLYLKVAPEHETGAPRHVREAEVREAQSA
jgi:hypothetical protein